MESSKESGMDKMPSVLTVVGGRVMQKAIMCFQTLCFESRKCYFLSLMMDCRFSMKMELEMNIAMEKVHSTGHILS